MKQFKQKCDIAYEQGNPLITDTKYDTIFGHNASAITSSDGTHTLPFFMGSLNKIKTEKSLNLWLNKNISNSFIVSPKLDGISALYHCNKLFTRGNGFKGSDITTFVKYLRLEDRARPGGYDQYEQDRLSFAFRGELVMKKNIFDQKYGTKRSTVEAFGVLGAGSREFKNPRNLVAGQFNKKEINASIVKDIDFVVYEIITGDEEISPSDQFNLVKTLFPGPGGPVALNYKKIDRQNITIDNLNDILYEFTNTSDYHIDGVVVTVDTPYTRNKSGNPKYSFALKNQNALSAIATVTKVQWTLSKWGFYIPVVHINPIDLSGCTISKLSGHNAKYIVENRIEEGARIVCIRSGDVIPHIVEVVKPSAKEIMLPSNCWDGVHVKRLENFNQEVEMKILTSLLTNLNVKNINIKTVEKLYSCFSANDENKSGRNVFFEILNCTELSLSEQFQEKTRAKILSEIANLKSQNIEIDKLISASGILGYGFAEKRIKLLFTHIPQFLQQKPTFDDLCGIEGFSSTLSHKILDNYETMIIFIQTCCENKLKLNTTENVKKEKMIICLSGFRDKILEQNYIVQNSVTKNCKLLIVNEENSSTTKVKQAEKLNIPIISRFKFTKSCESNSNQTETLYF